MRHRDGSAIQYLCTDYRGAMNQTEESLVIRVEGRLGRIMLNRPRQINALTLPMIDVSAPRWPTTPRSTSC